MSTKVWDGPLYILFVSVYRKRDVDSVEESGGL